MSQPVLAKTKVSISILFGGVRDKLYEISISINCFKWSNINSNNAAKYRKIFGYACMKTDKEFASLTEAKSYCSSDKECNWILSKYSIKDTYKICAKDDILTEKQFAFENDVMKKESSVYAKQEKLGKYIVRFELISFMGKTTLECEKRVMFIVL